MSPRPLRRRRGIMRRLLTVCLLAGLLIVPASSSQALSMCDESTPPLPERMGSIGEIEDFGKLNYENTKGIPDGTEPDMFSKHHLLGQKWPLIYSESCFDGARWDSWYLIYGPMWQFTRWLNAKTINFYYVATRDLADAQGEMVVRAVKAFRDAIWAPLITTMIILGAIWAAWTGLAQKRGTLSMQGIAWMVVALASGFWLLYNPSAAIQWSTKVTTFATDLSNQATLKMVSGGGGETGTSSCAGSTIYKFPDESAGEYAARRNATMLADGLSCAPWKQGMFGAPTVEEVDGQKRLVNYNGEAGAFIQAMAIDLTKPDEVPYNELVEKKAEDFNRAKTNLEKEHPGAYEVLNSNNGEERVAIAFNALAAAIFGGGIILVASLVLFAYKMAYVFGVMMLPIFALIAIHPGRGRIIAMAYLEYMVALLVKQGLVLIVIGLVTGVLGWILSGVESKTMQLGFMIALFLGLLFGGRALWRKAAGIASPKGQDSHSVDGGNLAKNLAKTTTRLLVNKATFGAGAAATKAMRTGGKAMRAGKTVPGSKKAGLVSKLTRPIADVAKQGAEEGPQIREWVKRKWQGSGAHTIPGSVDDAPGTDLQRAVDPRTAAVTKFNPDYKAPRGGRSGEHPPEQQAPPRDGDRGRRERLDRIGQGRPRFQPSRAPGRRPRGDAADRGAGALPSGHARPHSRPRPETQGNPGQAPRRRPSRQRRRR